MVVRASSVFSTPAVMALAALVLVACSDSDIKLPKIFGGNEVPPEVMAEPRVVPVPTAPPDRETWPLLGEVPSRPRDFTPQPTIDAAKIQMESDRDDAERLQQNYQAAPPVMPMAPQEP